jgi:serine protease AprX
MDVATVSSRARPAAVAALLALLLALPLTGGAGRSLTSGAPGAGGAEQTFLLRVDDAAFAAVADRVDHLGGRVVRRLEAVGSAVVRLPGAAAPVLARSAGVLGLTPDSSLQLLGSTWDPASDPGSMYQVARTTGARRAWAAGLTGRGVDVALIDSGVTAVPGLDRAGKVVNGPDLSFESRDPSTRTVDTFGHGTFMAGLIAGSDGADKLGSAAPADYAGMAPDARLVSVKVADREGRTDVSQVIAAIDWVIEHRHDGDLDIRVLNLSFGTPSRQEYLLDPLAFAAEMAWRKGIVVVVSAGNDGTGTGKLLNPAQDPYVLAVGAEDSQGTVTTEDDTIADFSTRGDGSRNPDLVAPGKSLQGLRVPGSFIDDNYGDTAAFGGGRYFRGSGTSQAAAVVSGAAALLLQQRPWLTPDQVKALLTRSAAPLPAAGSQAQGSGLVDVWTAMQAGTPSGARQWFPLATGGGSLDRARGGLRLVLRGVPLYGERDVFGRGFAAAEHARDEENDRAWSGSSWAGSSWAGSSWAGTSWGSASWSGSSWAGSSWAGSSWAGSSWAGSSWAGSSWASATWG